MIRSDDEADYERDARPLPRAVPRPPRSRPTRRSRSTFSGRATTMRNNRVLAERFRANMAAYGIDDQGDDPNAGSTDMANVSWVCPTIHPDLAIAPEGDARPLDPVPRRRRDAGGRRDRPCSPRRSSPRPRSSCSPTRTLVAAAWQAFRGDRLTGPSRPRPARRPADRYHRRRRVPLDDRLEPAAPPARRDPTARRPAATVSGGTPWPSAPTPTPTADAATSRARTAGTATFETYTDFDLPTYVGPVDVHEAAVDHRPGRAPPAARSMSRSSAPRSTTRSATGPGARFGPRAIREAQYTSGSINSLQLDVEPFEVLTVVDAGDANIVPAWIERGHALIYRKVLEVAEQRARSRSSSAATTRSPGRAPPPSPRSAGPGSIGIVHFDAHADTAADDWGVLAGHGTPMRRLIESGAVKGKNFVQVGLRGYWPPVETFDWMQEQGLRCHFMREIEERGAEAVIARGDRPRRSTARTSIYLSLDIDVIDPGHGPRHRHARARRDAHAARCCGPSARSSARSTSRAWTSSRSRRRTTTPRRRRWSPTGPRSRRSARWPSSAAAGQPVRWAGVPFPATGSRPAAQRHGHPG